MIVLCSRLFVPFLSGYYRTRSRESAAII